MELKFRRTFTEEDRKSFVNEVLESGSNIMIAKLHNLNEDLLSRWVCNYRRYGVTIMPKEPKVKKVVPNYKKEYQKLQKQLEEKDFEIEVLRELLEKKKIAQKKG